MDMALCLRTGLVACATTMWTQQLEMVGGGSEVQLEMVGGGPEVSMAEVEGGATTAGEMTSRSFVAMIMIMIMIMALVLHPIAASFLSDTYIGQMAQLRLEMSTEAGKAVIYALTNILALAVSAIILVMTVTLTAVRSVRWTVEMTKRRLPA